MKYPLFPVLNTLSVLTHILYIVAVSEFHYILLSERECIVMNKLDNQLQYTLPIPLNPNEQVLSLVSDSIRKTYWLSTNQNLYEIIVTDEDRDIWKIYFERKQFKEAMAVAKVLKITIKIMYFSRLILKPLLQNITQLSPLKMGIMI